MLNRIISVKALDNQVLSIVFRNGVEKTYDIKSLYSKFPQFKELAENTRLYGRVQVDVGGYGIYWNDYLDLDADELWSNGVETGKIHKQDIKNMIAEELVFARETRGITQKQLSERVGIYQAEISKIERGLSNPSINTLHRLAEGLGMELEIRFINL